MHETFSRVRTLHEPRGPRACGASQRLTATHRGRPQANRRKSEQTGTQAKSQAYEAFRLGPRGNVLVGIRFFPHLAGDFGKGQTLPNNARSEFAEAVTVIHILPIVEPKSLFIDVAEQVEGLNANVGSTETALQETPEVFHAVRVNISANVFLSVIDNVVRVLASSSSNQHRRNKSANPPPRVGGRFLA
jgi:hypothetical protein